MLSARTGRVVRTPQENHVRLGFAPNSRSHCDFTRKSSQKTNPLKPPIRKKEFYYDTPISSFHQMLTSCGKPLLYVNYSMTLCQIGLFVLLLL
ncbi:hypothetical protein C812_03466 [Paenibacillus barengoltzii G22]|uniref:Uncharacterized protein n=1 Tax=Paenibacillus barengoltzii G22 TaxID=1235795 RepID=R9L749_9BACL|nr:hypothetical protein C812_03466 [Paenibacillus barengoltzii G22]